MQRGIVLRKIPKLWLWPGLLAAASSCVGLGCCKFPFMCDRGFTGVLRGASQILVASHCKHTFQISGDQIRFAGKESMRVLGNINIFFCVYVGAFKLAKAFLKFLNYCTTYTVIKRLAIFPSPAGMSITFFYSVLTWGYLHSFRRNMYLQYTLFITNNWVGYISLQSC